MYHAERPAVLPVDGGALCLKDGDTETETGEGEDNLQNVEAQLESGDHLRVPFQVFEHVAWWFSRLSTAAHFAKQARLRPWGRVGGTGRRDGRDSVIGRWS